MIRANVSGRNSADSWNVRFNMEIKILAVELIENGIATQAA